MKALKILKKIRNSDNDYDHLKTHPFDEAIKELEEFEAYEIKLSSLTNENKSLAKTLEKYNEEMINLRKENQELKKLIKN